MPVDEVTISHVRNGNTLQSVRLPSRIDFEVKLEEINDPARKRLAEVRERDCSEPGDDIVEKAGQLAVTCAWVRHKLLDDVLDAELEQQGLETLTHYDLLLEDLAGELSRSMRQARQAVRKALRLEMEKFGVKTTSGEGE